MRDEEAGMQSLGSVAGTYGSSCSCGANACELWLLLLDRESKSTQKQIENLLKLPTLKQSAPETPNESCQGKVTG